MSRRMILIDDNVQSCIDLSRYDIYGNKILRTTANCYVISETGYYLFPLVYGNGIKNGYYNADAYTRISGTYTAEFVNYKNNIITSPLIETDTATSVFSVEVIMADDENIISDITIENGSPRCIKFAVDRIPAAGANAIIAVKDVNGDIMWSWHIWLWNQVLHPLTKVTLTNASGNNYDILPYNLATKFDVDGTHMKSWYYQWGRKDPLLCAAACNSTTNHANYGTMSYSAVSGASKTVADAIKNPNQLLKNSGVNNNWCSLSYYYNFWSANEIQVTSSEINNVKTIYDPCPIGFKVPNSYVFSYFSSSNKIGIWNYGWNFKRNTSDINGVYFNALGQRNDSNGFLESTGLGGNYWMTGNPNYNSAYRLFFHETEVNSRDSQVRSRAFSLRPTADI